MELTHEEFCKYVDGLQPGERVIETGQCGMRGHTGHVYVSNNPGPAFGTKCVSWDPWPGETGRMGTAVTRGTRRISDVPDFKVNMSEALEKNPNLIADPVERALLVFTQWHVDEVIGDAEAADYARRLIERLAQYGLVVTHAPTDASAHLVQRYELAGFDLVGKRLENGKLQLGLEDDGPVVDNWPEAATLGAGYNTYTLEEVKKNHAGPKGQGIEWGVYV